MFKIEWDTNTGGVILTSQSSDRNIGISPRPVFKEELIMLALDTSFGWQIPNTETPLLWACNKQYFYKGQLAFIVKGGNMYEEASVNISEWAEGLIVEPIDIEGMLEKNKEELFLIESEAIEFIRDTFSMYSSKKTRSKQTVEIDFEKLVTYQEKKTKTKMAIIKQDCDSFDIMPLEMAETKGKKIYQTAQKIVLLNLVSQKNSALSNETLSTAKFESIKSKPLAVNLDLSNTSSFPLKITFLKTIASPEKTDSKKIVFSPLNSAFLNPCSAHLNLAFSNDTQPSPNLEFSNDTAPWLKSDSLNSVKPLPKLVYKKETLHSPKSALANCTEPLPKEVTLNDTSPEQNFVCVNDTRPPIKLASAKQAPPPNLDASKLTSKPLKNAPGNIAGASPKSTPVNDTSPSKIAPSAEKLRIFCSGVNFRKSLLKSMSFI
ncbi:MAG: hypothetical protein SNJ29_10190 [Rikenellaceae bacterium]